MSFKVPTKGTYFNPQFIAEWIEPICSDDELRQIRLDAPASLEVIGNIYQNPELLEGKKDE